MDGWNKLATELKLLRARKQVNKRLPQKDEERLKFLEERLGDSPEVKRIAIEEPVDNGPTRQTSKDAHATAVSEKLLNQAEEFKATKAWEKDVQRDTHSVFAAKDDRQGKATFQQKGLSPFAVDLPEDLKGEGVGVAQEPVEEEVVGEKEEGHRAISAGDDLDGLVKKATPNAGNPFALEVDDTFLKALGSVDNEDSLVPDTAAKSHEVELEETEPDSTGEKNMEGMSKDLEDETTQSAAEKTQKVAMEPPGEKQKEPPEEIDLHAYFEDETETVPTQVSPPPPAFPPPMPAVRKVPGPVLVPVGKEPESADEIPAFPLSEPRRATVFFKDGVTRRGVVTKVDFDGGVVCFEPPAGTPGKSEQIPIGALAVVFFLVSPGTPAQKKQGRSVHVTLQDGRALEGTTPDHHPTRAVFTLYPADDRGNIERILVVRDAVKNISFL
jgi:hypothetical protein